MIYTIGHSNHTPDLFVKLLKGAGVNTVIDVRSNPKSRFEYFQREPMYHMLKNNGLGYLWGGRYLGGKTNISVKDDKFVDKMNTVVELSHTENVCLCCAERHPHECHRAMKLTAWLIRQGVQTQHILMSGEVIDAKEYEDKGLIKKTSLWHEFGGNWGKPKPPLEGQLL